MTMGQVTLAGRYRLVARVGEGGMAIVWRAVDERLGRPVAIKVLREQFASDAELVERFRREAQAAASLSHPNVVQIFDVGRDGGRPFIVMELVDGLSLKELLRRHGRLSPPAAVAVAVGVARALAHAHRHGVVHRDIKPHNILLTTEGLVKVADFGIARAASATLLTQAGTVLGSVHYFSPEQARGQAIGPASDLYSLGVVLYEMLTGRLPFTADSPIAVALQHVQEAPPPPRRLRPEVSAALERCVLHLLAKEPGQRPPSAEAAAEELRACEPQAEAFPLVGLLRALPVAEAGQRLSDASPGGQATQVVVGLGRGQGPTPAVDGQTPARGPRAIAAGAPRKEAEATTVAATSGRGQPPRRRRPLRWAFVGAFLAGLTAAGGTLSDWLFPREVGVPNVVGRPEAEARAILQRSGLDYAVDRRVYSSLVPAGYVVSQDPEPGRQVREGRKIWATVSLGPEVGEVPDVVGRPLRDARVMLTQQGFVLGTVEEGYAPDVPPNTVVAQDPPGAIRLEKGRPVNLVVSRGREPLAAVRLPDFTGMQVSDVAAELQRMGLTLGATWAEHSPQPQGTVIDQNPQPGAEVSQGDRVDLVYSQGPAIPEPAAAAGRPAGPTGPASPGLRAEESGGVGAGGPPAAGQEPSSAPAGRPGAAPPARPAPPTPPGGDGGAATAGKWRTAEVTVQVPQGPDQEVVILVIDDFGPSEAFRRVVPGGSVLVEQVHGRGEQARFQVYIDGRMAQDAPFPGAGRS